MLLYIYREWISKLDVVHISIMTSLVPLLYGLKQPGLTTAAGERRSVESADSTAADGLSAPCRLVNSIYTPFEVVP